MSVRVIFDKSLALSFCPLNFRPLSFWLFWCAVLFSLFVPAPIQAQPLNKTNIKAELVAETLNPAPGSTVTVAITMTPQPGWHDYWINPGDAGTPLELEWNLPKGVIAGPIRAPVPKLLWVFGFANYVYEDRHAFLIDLTVPKDMVPGAKLPIGVQVNWSECTDKICVPGAAKLTLDMQVGEGVISSQDQVRFDGYRAALPLTLDRSGRYMNRGNMVQIAIPYPADAALDEVYFFPLTGDIFNYSAQQKARRTGDMLILELAAKAQSTATTPITGLLRLGQGNGVLVTLEAGAVPTGGDGVAVYAGTGKNTGILTGRPPTNNLIAIIGLAILGGLLLNLMPCVFPILGLKALSLAKMGANETAARRDAMGYSAGAILGCIALGALMLLLRAGGEQVGWAFQLQEPRVVLALFLLMIAITANLAGLYEITLMPSSGITDGAQSRWGSFGTGILAAIIATPCTGPFMAVAMGAALLLPAYQALILFAALGLGLALPYLAIAFIPALRRRLPKPGSWLRTFRYWMALPMGLTTLALGWLLWRLSGHLGGVIAIVSVVALLAILWRVRVAQYTGKAATMATVSALITAAVLILCLPNDPAVQRADAAQDSPLNAESYSDDRLAQYLRQRRGVFVYFTADWCVTCKANEATAIHRQATADHFKKTNIAVLVGDFTRKDARLARILERHGTAGVPLYLWYPPNSDPDNVQPQQLPQILSSNMLTQLR